LFYIEQLSVTVHCWHIILSSEVVVDEEAIMPSILKALEWVIAP
jgi:hypothetical protein